VTIEIVLLALASAIRPSSLVVVYALIRGPAPSRLMAAYVAAGLVFTLAVGASVTWAFNGIQLRAGTDRTRAIAELAAGVMALGLGAGVLSGRVRVGRAAEAPAPEHRWGRLQQRQITTRTAALAGPATHIPGLFYVLALDLIVSAEPDVAGGLIEMGIFNAIWFALPILVLVTCIVDPSAARARVQGIQDFAGAHARAIILAISFGLGGWLTLHGATTI
jgi:hypothetical protein